MAPKVTWGLHVLSLRGCEKSEKTTRAFLLPGLELMFLTCVSSCWQNVATRSLPVRGSVAPRICPVGSDFWGKDFHMHNAERVFPSVNFPDL